MISFNPAMGRSAYAIEKTRTSKNFDIRVADSISQCLVCGELFQAIRDAFFRLIYKTIPAPIRRRLMSWGMERLRRGVGPVKT